MMSKKIPIHLIYCRISYKKIHKKIQKLKNKKPHHGNNPIDLLSKK